MNSTKRRILSGNMKLKRIIEIGRDLNLEGKRIKNLIGMREMKEEEDLTHMKIGKRKILSAGKKEMEFRLLLNRPKI